MGKRRDLATFFLLVHLANHAGYLEASLAGDTYDATRASIEAKANHLTGEHLENETTFLFDHGNDNFPGSHLATTSASILAEEETKLEGELEEALEEIASSGGIVLISSPKAEHKNSTRGIPAGSLILIESSLTTSRSLIETDNDEGIDRSGTIHDQEIAQSQTRARSSPVPYVDREDIEDIEDLLAIVEYEPQKIDVVRIDATKAPSPPMESMRPQLPEETHYDIPRRQNVSKNTRRTSNLADEALSPKTNPEGFSTRAPLEIPSHLDQVSAKKGRTWFGSQLPDYSHQTGRKKSSLTSKIHEKLANNQRGDWPRESRHLKPTRSSSRTPSSPLLPRLSESFGEQLNYSRLNGSRIKNVTVVDKASKKKVGPRSITTQTSAEIVPAIEQNKITVGGPEPYPSNVYSRPEKTQIHAITDQQLGFLTRYDMPPLLMPRPARFRPYLPVARKIAAPGHSEIDVGKSPGLGNENGHPRAYQPDYDYEENSGETIQTGRTSPRTRGVIGGSEEPAVYQSHGENYQPSIEATLSKNAAETFPNPTISENHQSYRNAKARKAPQLARQSLKNYPGLPSQAILQRSDYAGQATDGSRPIHSSDATVPAHGSDRQVPEALAAAYVNAPNDPSIKFNGAQRSPLQKGNTHEVRIVRSDGEDYSELSENAFGTSSPRAPYSNPQRTLTPTPTTASSGRGENSDSEAEKGRLDGTWKSASTIPNQPELHPAGQQTRPTSFASPEYDSYESEESAVEPALKTSTNGILEEGQSGNYGNRLGPLMQTVAEERLQPRTDYRKRPLKLPIQLNVSPRVKEKTAESVSRGDLVDREDHEGEENEEIADSSHEENREASKKDGDGDEEDESKGGGEKHEEGHHAEAGEKGEKGYKEWHDYDKGGKGHVDKESHEKEYDEKKGDEKKHEDESDYHKEYHHGEKGNKRSEFGEKGEHEKGHSTKGQHVVHKKDEYEKKTEFYDESHEEDGDEKEGGYHYEHENEKGGHEKIGHDDSAYHVDKHGERARHEKGRHWDESSGHNDEDGRERDHHHEERYGKAKAGEEGQKWSHKNGSNGKHE